MVTIDFSRMPKRAASKAMLECCRDLASRLGIPEPDYSDFNATSKFINNSIERDRFENASTWAIVNGYF